MCSSGKYLNLLRCVRALAAGWQRRVSVVVLCHNCLLGSLWLADVEGGEGREKMQIISTILACCRSWCEPRHSSLISCCSPPPSPPRARAQPVPGELISQCSSTLKELNLVYVRPVLYGCTMLLRGWWRRTSICTSASPRLPAHIV